MRDLRGVIEREGAQGAQIGVFICMEAPTKPMLKEAVGAGFYKPTEEQMALGETEIDEPF